MTYQSPASEKIVFSLASVDQRESTGLSPLSSSRAVVSYLYQPSYESVAEGVEGQDYVVLGISDRALVFAVCDGVGQSFFGQLAAKFLGDALLEWLGALEPIVDESGLAARLTELLADLTNAGQREVEAHALPENLPPLIQSAWEEQRVYGSETMFVCGRLQFSAGSADPTQPGQCVLCWLGDAEAQVFGRDGMPVDIGAEWSTSERWSTMKGIKGAEAAHVWACDLDQIDQVIAYTDGLDSIKDRLRQLLGSPDKLQQEINRIHESPEGDDITLISISPRRLAAPDLLEIHNPWRLGSYTLRWQVVPDADAYLVEESRDPSFEDTVSWVSEETASRIEGQPWGRHFFRVRAVVAGVQSEPSNVQASRTVLTLWFLGKIMG